MTVGVQLHHRCAACGTWIPVNGLLARVICPTCSKVTVFGAPGWKMLLEDVLRNAPTMAPSEGRSNPSAWTPDGQFQISYERAVVRCEGCKGDLPMDRAPSLVSRGYFACVGCGRRVGLRAPSASVGGSALAGVTLLVGEDLDQLAAAGDAAAQNAKEPITVPCRQCGSTLPVDGSSRSVSCRFCNAQNYLPDPIWLRLHPVKTATWWYLWSADAGAGGSPTAGASAGAATGPYVWDGGSLLHAAADHEGNVYVVQHAGGFSEGGVTVFSIDTRTYQARWIQRDVKMKTPCELVMGWGQVLLWSDKRHAALRFDAASGRPLGDLGGIEPEGTPVRMLDLKGAASFTYGGDDTYVVFIHNRVLRYGGDCRGVPTWPTGREDLGPLYRNHVTSYDEDYKQFYDDKLQRLARAPSFGDVKWAKEVSHQPRALTAGFLKGHIGWDGFLYMLDWSDKLLLRFDRDGRMIYRTKLPLDDVRFSRVFHADRSGHAFVLGESASDRKTVVRVTPDGRATAVLTDRRARGPLDPSESCMALAPDGRLWMIGDEGILHAFAPDGNIAYVSPAARDAATRGAGEDEDDD